MDSTIDFSEAVSDLDVDNVYIYAGDAVRWDFLPDGLAERGLSIKTVSASTTSAPSFTSLLSGLYPTSHQVFSFNYKLGDAVPTMLDLREFYTGFLNSIFAYATREHDGPDPIYRTLGIDAPPTRPEFDDTPFVFVERGPGGHAPYGDFAGGATEYFEDHHDRTEDELRADYERSIELDVKLFEERIDDLQSRGLLDDTLVIYTSDHGELLGENGMIGHNSPMCPETVYVPSVFIHPDLPSGSIVDGVIGHVDLFPTILDVLDVDPGSSFDGRSLVDDWTAEPRCTIYHNEFLTDRVPITDGRLRFDGVWDRTGGYVFPKSNLRERLFVLLGKVLKSPKRHYLRRNLPTVLKEYSRGEQTYRDPGFPRADAKARLEALYEGSANGLRRELDRADEERLEDLGYL